MNPLTRSRMHENCTAAPPPCVGDDNSSFQIASSLFLSPRADVAAAEHSKAPNSADEAEWRQRGWKGITYRYTSDEMELAFLEHYVHHRFSPIFVATLGVAIILSLIIPLVPVRLLTPHVLAIHAAALIGELITVVGFFALLAVKNRRRADAGKGQYDDVDGGSTTNALTSPSQTTSALKRHYSTSAGLAFKLTNFSTDARWQEFLMFANLLIWAIVPTFGTSHRVMCLDIKPAMQSVVCGNGVFIDSYSVVTFTLAYFFMKIRVTQFGLVAAVLCAFTAAAHLISGAYPISTGSFWALVFVATLEGTLCTVTKFRSECSARDHFEMYVDKQAKSSELVTVRKRTEAMVSAQVPLAAVRRGALSDKDGVWGFHQKMAVCCIAIHGFAPWCSRRSPADAVELLQVVLHSLDAVRRNSPSAPVKYHSFGDQYVLSLTPLAETLIAAQATCCDLLIVCLNAILVADDAVAAAAASWGTMNRMLTKGDVVECNRAVDVLHMCGGLDVGPGCGVIVRRSKNIHIVGSPASRALSLAAKISHRGRTRRILNVTDDFAAITLPWLSSCAPSRATVLTAQSFAESLRENGSLALRETVTNLSDLAVRKFDVLVMGTEQSLNSLGTDESQNPSDSGTATTTSHELPQTRDNLSILSITHDLAFASFASPIDDQLECLVIEYRWLLFPRFRGAKMETEYTSLQGEDDRGGEMWVFLVEVAAHGVLLAVFSCLVAEVHFACALLSVLTVVLAAALSLLSLFSDLHQRTARALFTVAYLLYVVAFVGTSFTSQDGNFIKYSTPLLIMMLCAQTTKFPLWNGPVVMSVVDVLVGASALADERFGRRIFWEASPLMSKFCMIMFAGIPLVVFLCRLRWSAQLREEFAVHRSIALLEEQLRVDYERLEEVLRELAPEGFTRDFISHARATAASQPRKATQRLTVRPDVSTNVTTASEDIPFVVVKLKIRNAKDPSLPFASDSLSKLLCAEGELRDSVAALQSCVERVINALAFCAPKGAERRTVEIVKASLDTIVAAAAVEGHRSLDDHLELRCSEVIFAARRSVSVLLTLRDVIDFKVVMGCGQSIGGVLGNDCASFEFYGGSLGFAQELAKALPWGTIVSSPKLLRAASFMADYCDHRYYSASAVYQSLGMSEIDDPLWEGVVPICIPCSEQCDDVQVRCHLQVSPAVAHSLRGFSPHYCRFVSFLK